MAWVSINFQAINCRSPCFRIAARIAVPPQISDSALDILSRYVVVIELLFFVHSIFPFVGSSGMPPSGDTSKPANEGHLKTGQ
jgi:hypothetical protein